MDRAVFFFSREEIKKKGIVMEKGMEENGEGWTQSHTLQNDTKSMIGECLVDG